MAHTTKTASLAVLAKGSKGKSPKAAKPLKPAATHTPTSVKQSRAQRALKRSASEDTVDFEVAAKAARLQGAKAVAPADAAVEELPMVSEEANGGPRTEAEESGPEAMAVEAAETTEAQATPVEADGGEGVPSAAEPTMGTKRLSQIFSSPPTEGL